MTDTFAMRVRSFNPLIGYYNESKKRIDLDNLGKETLTAAAEDLTFQKKIWNKVRSSISKATAGNAVTNAPWYNPPAWSNNAGAGTQYYAGQCMVSSDTANVFICRQSGLSATSGSGPTGSPYAPVTDGTAIWEWLGPINGLNAYSASTVTYATHDSVKTSIGSFNTYLPSLSKTIGIWSGGYLVASNSVIDILGPNSGTVGSPSILAAMDASVTFMTDSSKIAFLQNNGPFSAGISPGIVVEVNDRLLTPSALLTSTTISQYGAVLIDLGFLPKNSEKKVRIWTKGNKYLSSCVSQVLTDGNSSIWTPKNVSSVFAAFEGDSLTQSANNAPYRAGMSWPAQCSSLLGFDRCANFGIGSVGFLSNGSNLKTTHLERLGRFVGLKADIYIGGGNHNDSTYTSAQRIAAVLTYLQAFRALEPLAPLIWFGNTLLQGESGTAGGVYQAEVDLAAAFAQFNDSNTIFVPILTDPNDGSWITGTGTTAAPAGNGNADKYFLAAGQDAHPLQRGYSYLAKRYANALTNVFM